MAKEHKNTVYSTEDEKGTKMKKECKILMRNTITDMGQTDGMARDSIETEVVQWWIDLSFAVH